MSGQIQQHPLCPTGTTSFNQVQNSNRMGFRNAPADPTDVNGDIADGLSSVIASHNPLKQGTP
jgi:hypothetical protein